MRCILSEPSLTGFVSRYEYVIGYPASPGSAGGCQSLSPLKYTKGESIFASREDREVDLSPCIETAECLEVTDPAIRALFGYDVEWAYRLMLRDSNDVKIRLGEISAALFGIEMEELMVIRTHMYGRTSEQPDTWKEPL
jgi:hypothetical protein